jgi:cytochrome b
MTDPIEATAEHGDPVLGAVTPTTNAPESERVWDPFVRIFHWGLAVAVLVAFLTEDDLLGLHTWAGYTVIGLIAVRILWGVIGPDHARFADFVRGPRATLAYLGDVLRGHPARYLGHNPAGAAMVIALIGGLIATALTGVATLDNEGMKDVHEAIAYGTLCLVALHLLGVALASRQHNENLVRAMINGHKRK